MSEILQKYIKIRRIKMSGKSSSGRTAVGEIVYAYIIDSETFQEDLIEFIDKNILDSVHQICPVSITEKKNVFTKEELEFWINQIEIPYMTLYLSPYFSDEEWVNVPENAGRVKEMPVIPINLYMKYVGCQEDVFSPFNRIELRYPLVLNDECVKFVERFFDFSKKSIRSLKQLAACQEI